VLIDAIVLAGGRSSRLGSVPKAGLIYQHSTLLDRTLTAVAHLRRTVVVGSVDAALPAHVLLSREDPPFGGPAAGIAAGVATLTQADPAPSDFVLVLACDMPEIDTATTTLLARVTSGSTVGDGLISLDQNERLQPLAALYDRAALSAALAEHERAGTLDGLSAFRLISGMKLTPVAVPPGSTDDVDTWEDAARFGIPKPETSATQEPNDGHARARPEPDKPDQSQTRRRSSHE
jgi:molybdopterin-guanine dinucleotide biosynthesis protein A